jgi:endogenous inhibitor of DNA gyrase (YacG/DUF329 family)
MHYIKIWIRANGPIPKDNNGISYEIHHIDGNRNNNSLDNLICVSIEEHFKIHKYQKDYQAAWRIANRMKLSKEEIRKIAVLGGQAKKGIKKKRVICPKCGKEGNIDAMTRWHFDKCGSKKPNPAKSKVKCPKCGKEGSPRGLKRWHFDNCGKKYIITDEQKLKYKKLGRKKIKH